MLFYVIFCFTLWCRNPISCLIYPRQALWATSRSPLSYLALISSTAGCAFSFSDSGLSPSQQSQLDSCSWLPTGLSNSGLLPSWFSMPRSILPILLSGLDLIGNFKPQIQTSMSLLSDKLRWGIISLRSTLFWHWDLIQLFPLQFQQQLFRLEAHWKQWVRWLGLCSDYLGYKARCTVAQFCDTEWES